MSFGYSASWDLFLTTSFITHDKPIANPVSLSPITNFTTVFSSNRVTNLKSMADEIESWNQWGLPQYWNAITISANATLLLKALDIFFQETECMNRVPGMLPNFLVQPIDQIAKIGTAKNGGNPFGISPEDGPLWGKYNSFFGRYIDGR